MNIDVLTNDVQARTPLEFTLIDRSGAHVILTVSIEGRPPIRHSFDFDEGTLTVPVELKRGEHRCSLVVQALKHGALNGMYDTALTLNGQPAAMAKGRIPSGRTNAVGIGDFVVQVV